MAHGRGTLINAPKAGWTEATRRPVGPGFLIMPVSRVVAVIVIVVVTLALEVEVVQYNAEHLRPHARKLQSRPPHHVLRALSAAAPSSVALYRTLTSRQVKK